MVTPRSVALFTIWKRSILSVCSFCMVFQTASVFYALPMPSFSSFDFFCRKLRWKNSLLAYVCRWVSGSQLVHSRLSAKQKAWTVVLEIYSAQTYEYAVMTATEIRSPSGMPVLLFMVRKHYVVSQNSFGIHYICIHWSHIIFGHPNFTTTFCLVGDPSCCSIFRGPKQNRMHAHHDGELFHKHVEWQTTRLHTIFLANRHKLTKA